MGRGIRGHGGVAVDREAAEEEVDGGVVSVGAGVSGDAESELAEDQGEVVGRGRELQRYGSGGQCCV